jgi:hypothetical protein
VTEYICLYELEHFLGTRVAETLPMFTGSASCKKMGVLALLCVPFLIYFVGLDLAMAVHFVLAGYPLPHDLLESWHYSHTTTQIFELKGVTRKIFQTKELADAYIIFGLTAQLHD